MPEQTPSQGWRFPSAFTILFGLIILGFAWAATVAFVMRHAASVKADPSKSLVFDRKVSNWRIS
jgi:uncharacterized ion transporter superfamily protein YfcC